jgi:formate-dependent nitrite reductase membrane component NrfD
MDAPLPIASRHLPIRPPAADQPATYYGRPALKPSLYGWTVALYIFIGGLAGAAQILATAAHMTGMHQDPVVSAGRMIALAGAVLGSILLILDLHTRQRFYNMLRIFRPTSAMSIGTYVLMNFGFWSVVALCGQFTGLGWLAALGGVIASVAGWGMMSYTAALLTATSTPLWAAAPRLLAVRFSASAMATAAAALAIVAVCSADGAVVVGPLRRIAIVALIIDLGAGVLSQHVYHNHGVAQPLRVWPWGPALLAGQFAGAVVPLALYQLAETDPVWSLPATVIASLCVLGGGLLLRGVILLAGNASAGRPEDYFRWASLAPDRRGE